MKNRITYSTRTGKRVLWERHVNDYGIPLFRDSDRGSWDCEGCGAYADTATPRQAQTHARGCHAT